MTQISIRNLTFNYPGSSRIIFNNVSLTLDSAWKLGLIGRNGRGKTTFLRLLYGRYEYEGQISAKEHFEFFPYPLPVADSLADSLGLTFPDLEIWRVERELDLLGVDPDVLLRPQTMLSGGELTKVRLAAMFARDNGFQLIDEPTNHLDLLGREAVSAYLRKKSGFILVSHDRSFLDSCIDHVLAINKSGIELCQGNYSTWKQDLELREQYEFKQQAKLKREIKHLDEAAKRSEGWSRQLERTKYRNGPVDKGFIGHKAAKLMKRSVVLADRQQQAVEQKSQLLKDLEEVESLKFEPLQYHARFLIQAENLIWWRQPDQPFSQGLSLNVERGRKIALLGPNGSGKTSLLKLLLGEDVPHSGLLKLGGGLKISRLDQDLSGIKGKVRDLALDLNLEQNLFRAILSRLNLSKEFWEIDLAELSDGQRKKAALAVSLCTPAHLYIWDEPLNFMDIQAREQLEALLKTHNPTMIFVEHDRTFVEQVADQIVELQVTQQ